MDPPDHDRDRLTETEARFRSLAENAAEAIITIDADDHVIFANRAAERIFGYPAAEMSDMRFTQLIPERFRQQHRAAVARYLATGEKRLSWNGVELPGLKRDGSEVPLEITFGEYTHNGRRFFTGIMRDISGRQRAEQERLRLLDREQQARAEAESANRAKSDFLATMSHELRTPINAIMGYADLLDARIAGPLNAAQAQQIARIDASSRHLLSLVEDILDLAKGEGGRLTVEHDHCLVINSVSQALLLIADIARERRIEIHDQCSVSGEIGYIGDEQRVRQILVNLLSNAVKFTDSDGRITVSCGTIDEPPPATVLSVASSWTFISVADTGVGIGASELERIFRPFVQLEGGLTRTKRGTGLGLTISRQLARLMDGDLTVESTLGRGSMFTLWLPHELVPGFAKESGLTADTSARALTSRGFAKVGEALIRNVDDILHDYVERLRAERIAPDAGAFGEADLMDHAGTFLTDIGQALIVLESSTQDPITLMRDGTEIQRVISELHGAQRARLGWTEEMLAREWQILRQETRSVLQRGFAQEDSLDINAATTTLLKMMEQAERISRLGMRRALSYQS